MKEKKRTLSLNSKKFKAFKRMNAIQTLIETICVTDKKLSLKPQVLFSKVLHKRCHISIMI